MIKHQLYLRHSRVKPEGRLSVPLIKSCIAKTLELEGMDMPCEISVMVIDNKAMRAMNRQYRGIDETTDVLSFPMQHFSAPCEIILDINDMLPNLEYLQLGDILISAERAASQAEEYGHSIERETAYLTIHSTLHLLGYDHMEETDKKLMREREEVVIEELGSRI